MEEEIKNQMKILRERWAGKPEPEHGTMEYIKRGIDRIIYQKLQKRLNNMGIHGARVLPPEKDIDLGREIFKNELK